MENCSSPGWYYPLDTTLIADGVHTLSLVDGNSAAPANNATVQFTVANGAATASTGKRLIKSFQFVSKNSASQTANGQFISIESPSAAETVPSALSIAGWAVSQVSAVTDVDILIDGVPMGAAQYGFARPDVCKAYPSSLSCPNVGWYYLLDTRTLGNGVHTVEAVEITAGGNAAVSQKFTVSNTGLESSILAVVDSPAAGATLSSSYLASGWAIDKTDTIATVAISVDDLPQGFAAYGGARGDVCTAFPGRAGCPNVGWSLWLDTTQWQNGSHTLSVIVTSKAGDVLTLTRVIQTAN